MIPFLQWSYALCPEVVLSVAGFTDGCAVYVLYHMPAIYCCKVTKAYRAARLRVLTSASSCQVPCKACLHNYTKTHTFQSRVGFAGAFMLHELFLFLVAGAAVVVGTLGHMDRGRVSQQVLHKATGPPAVLLEQGSCLRMRSPQ